MPPNKSESKIDVGFHIGAFIASERFFMIIKLTSKRIWILERDYPFFKVISLEDEAQIDIWASWAITLFERVGGDLAKINNGAQKDYFGDLGKSYKTTRVYIEPNGIFCESIKRPPALWNLPRVVWVLSVRRLKKALFEIGHSLFRKLLLEERKEVESS